MIRKGLTRIDLIVGCTVGIAVPMALAQTDTQIQSTAPRIKFGTQGDRFLDLTPGLSEGRIRMECGSITNAHLRASCIDSLAVDEDRRSMSLRDGMTGGGDGRINPTDRTFQDPEMYDPRFGR